MTGAGIHFADGFFRRRVLQQPLQARRGNGRIIAARTQKQRLVVVPDRARHGRLGGRAVPIEKHGGREDEPVAEIDHIGGTSIVARAGGLVDDARIHVFAHFCAPCRAEVAAGGERDHGLHARIARFASVPHREQGTETGAGEDHTGETAAGGEVHRHLYVREGFLKAGEWKLRDMARLDAEAGIAKLGERDREITRSFGSARRRSAGTVGKMDDDWPAARHTGCGRCDNRRELQAIARAEGENVLRRRRLALRRRGGRRVTG